MKKILITGSNGFIGANAANCFKNKVYYIAGSDLFPVVNHLERVLNTFTLGEVSCNALKSLDTEFDVILHCAGGSSVAKSVEDPFADYQSTILSLLNVLEYIRLYNKNAVLIYPSSAAVYGNSSKKPMAEEDDCRPMSPYGWHKLQAESLCREYSELYGIRCGVLRIFSCYGPGLQKQLFWDIYQKSLKSDHITLSGTGKELRNFIYIDDVVEFIGKLADTYSEDKSRKFEIVNLGSEKSHSIREVIDIYRKYLKPSLEIEFNGISRAGDPAGMTASTEKLKSFGFCANTSIEIGLKQYTNWLKTYEY